jgi:site-specific recombinase XerD
MREDKNLRKRGRVYYIDICHKGIRIRQKVGASKHLARLKLNEIRLQIEKGELGYLKKDSDLEKLFQEFYKYSDTNHSPSTIRRYTAILDHFKEFLTKRHPEVNKISQLNNKLFEDYKAYRKHEDAQPKTINIELGTLKAMFYLAMKWGYTATNPVVGVDRMKTIRKQEPRFLTEEECDKLLSNCNEWQYPIFCTFLHTGMRKQELMNLEWNDVDFDRRIIKIRIKDGWTPKTAERNIPIGNGLLKLLQEHKEKTKKGNLVFHDGEGNKIENNKLRKQLMKITRKNGLADITKLHTLRHTFASHLVMKGVDLPTVKQLLGHSDISTTMIYSHLAPNHLTDAVDKLNF